jgi:hypothetical protein
MYRDESAANYLRPKYDQLKKEMERPNMTIANRTEQIKHIYHYSYSFYSARVMSKRYQILSDVVLLERERMEYIPGQNVTPTKSVVVGAKPAKVEAAAVFV